MQRKYIAIIFAAGIGLTPAVSLDAGAKSDKKIKISAAASKIDADGNQVVSVTLDIDKGWHIYANPVGNVELRGGQIDVKLNAQAPLQCVKVMYPPGTPRSDKDYGDYKIYEGRVSVKVATKRAAGDTGPLELAFKLQVCNKDICRPMMEKLTLK